MLPLALPTLSREPATDGGLRVTVEYERPAWQRRLGAGARGRRTFELDPLGHEVYATCDGTRTVGHLIRDFAALHRVSLAEAEISITSYLRTLTTKGIVALVAPETSV